MRRFVCFWNSNLPDTVTTVEFEFRGKFVNGEVIWSKILTLKVYGSYERQLGRKTPSPAHVLYFHFLCYPLPSPPLQGCVSCSWDQQLPGVARGEWTLTQIDALEGTSALSEPTWWRNSQFTRIKHCSRTSREDRMDLISIGCERNSGSTIG